MSIAVLSQVYDEARRLAVAGSVVARGDFRLKKLLPPLEQAGAKAPVFAKVAECAKAVIDGPEEASAENLLELTSLVTAVLYTQGETGLPGKLEPIESVNLGGTASQTSARLLKPLLEALSNTGSGRLEVIKEAHERGAFRDLRLVKPALNGLDDSYSEIADFLAEKVLPLYGKAIFEEVRAKYDPKGTKGHPRRLKLLHAFDPAGSRELVKQALADGSKEVKVAAIACLGAEKEDLSYLIEQAAAKAQDIRKAAYHALAAIDDPAAVAVLEKAITGKDLELAASAIVRSESDKLVVLLLAEIRKESDAMPKTKDKKQVSDKAQRLLRLIQSLPNREHTAADALILDLFARRAELNKIKGAMFSGSDVVEAVIDRMADGPKPLQTALARAHAELDGNELGSAVRAGRLVLPPAEVYDAFAPYVLATVGKKPGKKDKAFEKRDAVLEGLDVDMIRYHWGDDEEQQKLPPLDGRWLDVGLQVEDLGLIDAVAQPGNAKVNAVLTKLFDPYMGKGKVDGDVDEVLTTMIRLNHPAAVDSLITAYEKFVLKSKGYVYDSWYYRLIPKLPKDALPKLEAIIPKLKDQKLDQWVEAIQALRTKP